MSTIDRMAADASTPSGATISSVRLATTTSAEVVEIPDEWKGRFVRFALHGTAADTAIAKLGAIRFGTADSVSVSLTTTTTLASNVPNEVATVPHVVLDCPGFADERIDPSWTHFAHIEGATGGYFVATLKTGGGKVAA